MTEGEVMRAYGESLSACLQEAYSLACCAALLSNDQAFPESLLYLECRTREGKRLPLITKYLSLRGIQSNLDDAHETVTEGALFLFNKHTGKNNFALFSGSL